MAKEYMSFRMLMVYNRNVKGKNKKERLKKKYTRPTPDALMRINLGTCAIELENTKKEDFRYQDKIFPGYEENDRVDIVLYVCTSESILEGVNKNINDYKPPHIVETRFLVVEYKKVLNSDEFIAMNYTKRDYEENINIKDKINIKTGG